MTATISAALTTYGRNQLGNALLRATSFTPPAQLYLALLVADPTDAGATTNELSGLGYARAALSFGAPATVVTGGQGGQQWTNSAAATTPAATAAWSTAAYVALMDAPTGGQMWAKGQLATPVGVQAGYAFTVNAGGLLITLY